MFHIKITDLETGEVEVDAKTCCIIGAYDNGSRCASFQYNNCLLSDLILTIEAARDAEFSALAKVQSEFLRRCKDA